MLVPACITNIVSGAERPPCDAGGWHKTREPTRRGVRQGERQGPGRAEQLHEDQRPLAARCYSATGHTPPPASQATAKWGFCLLRPKAIVSGTVAVLVIQMMAGRSREDMLVPGTPSRASLTWNPAPGRARGRLTEATRPDGTAREDGSHKRR